MLNEEYFIALAELILKVKGNLFRGTDLHLFKSAKDLVFYQA